MIKSWIQSVWQAIIRVFAFIIKEIQLIIHQPRLLFLLILGPFLILLVFGIGYQGNPRQLTTLFVVPEGSPHEGYVRDFAEAFGAHIEFAGIVHDTQEATRQLREGEVELVVVTAANPSEDWERGEPSILTLYHREVDPLEARYVEVVGREYTSEVNRQLLVAALTQSQAEAVSWQDEIADAEARADAVKLALTAGDAEDALASAAELRERLDLLSSILRAGMPVATQLDGGTAAQDVGAALLDKLESLQELTDSIETTSQDGSLLETGQTLVTDIESSLERVDSLLQEVENVDPAILAEPFRTEAFTLTQVTVQPMHYYTPGAIAVLLQHIAITIAGLSIIREKLNGTLELIRAAPVTASQILFGKSTSYILVIGIVAAVLTVLVVYLLGVPFLGSWPAYTVVLIGVLLASLGIGFHISLSARSDSQAIQYGMLTLLAAIFFSGFFMPLYRLDWPVRALSWLLPATYGTALLQDIMLRGELTRPILLAILYGFGLVLMILAWLRLHRLVSRRD